MCHRRNAAWAGMSDKRDAPWAGMCHRRRAAWAGVSHRRDALWAGMCHRRKAAWAGVSHRRDAPWAGLCHTSNSQHQSRYFHEGAHIQVCFNTNTNTFMAAVACWPQVGDGCSTGDEWVRGDADTEEAELQANATNQTPLELGLLKVCLGHARRAAWIPAKKRCLHSRSSALPAFPLLSATCIPASQRYLHSRSGARNLHSRPQNCLHSCTGALPAFLLPGAAVIYAIER
eukprot:366542-Chlamydomonas_euryale.AAC.1